MPSDIRPFTALTGGGTGAVDKLDGDDLVTKDGGIVLTSTAFYPYYVDTAGGAAEDSPTVLVPDTNPGSINWELLSGVFNGLVSYDDVKIAATKKLYFDAGSNTYLVESAADNLQTYTGGSLATVIDVSQRMLVGHTASYCASGTRKLQVADAAGASAGLALFTFSDSVQYPVISFAKSHSDTLGTQAIVIDDEILGQLDFIGSDGNNFNTISARIRVEVDDAAPAADSIGGALVFSTAAGVGADDLTERLRIAADGSVSMSGALGVTGITTLSDDVKIAATKKLYLDAGSNTYLVESAADNLQTYTGGSLATVIDASQRMLVGAGAVAVPKTTTGGVDISNAVGGSLDLVLGADIGEATRTNVTRKFGVMGAIHYTVGQEPVAMLAVDANATTSRLRIGGGVGATNAATEISFFTAVNTITVTGTERLKIAPDGGIHPAGMKSGTDQADAGAAAGELYSDTNDDNTVKMGV